MKLIAFTVLLIATGLTGCTGSDAISSNAADYSNTAMPPKTVAILKQYKLTTEPKYPKVGLKEYTLITDDLERDRSIAEAVIQAKIGLPHAMQTKQRTDFEAVLARNFMFRGENEFYDREGYISNRVGDPIKVKQVDYRNVAVQLYGDRALVTYSNIAEDEPGGPGSSKADMSWADVLAKEDGQWKYESVHLIEYRDLTSPKK